MKPKPQTTLRLWGELRGQVRNRLWNQLRIELGHIRILFYNQLKDKLKR